MTTAHTSAYLLHPSGPLVFGTGKPLDFGLGGDTLTFPFPSTLAGAVRAAASASESSPPDPFQGRDKVLLGPTTLARLKASDLTLDTLLWPRPADAVYIGGKVVPLRPAAVPGSQFTDLPAGLQMLELEQHSDAKPDRAPAWWTTTELEGWLAAPAVCDTADLKGDPGTKLTQRVHVVIESGGAKGAEQGGLFRTHGQDFGPVSSTGPDHGGYAIALRGNSDGLDRKARRVGGEGRLARFGRIDGLVMPKAPDALGACVRFVLLTPAIFESNGWYPDWMARSDDHFAEGSVPGTAVRVKLAAAAITRAQSYSGWQPQGSSTSAPNCGGPGRPWRVVPAGSVYWFEVVEGDAKQLHACSLCKEQWLRDGWGYGLVGNGGGRGT